MVVGDFVGNVSGLQMRSEFVPAKSGAQYRLMQAVLHGDVQKEGISKGVAQEFVDKTPPKKRSTFSKHLSKKKKGR